MGFDIISPNYKSEIGALESIKQNLPLRQSFNKNMHKFDMQSCVY
jgi:hypothetical protein